MLISPIFRECRYKLHCFCKLRFALNRKIRVPRLLDCDSPCFFADFTVKLFADDVKMYVRILDDVDVRSLQLALDALVQWSDAWQLSISINNCCVLNIGKVTY